MKISLLFLTYGNPLHTNKWIEYIENPNFNIIIHPKYPDVIDDTWKPFLSSKLVETSWGTDSIIIATLVLLKQSLESDWVILCSEDSYPLSNCNDCLNYFNDKELSIFHPIDSDNPSKTSQWFALCNMDVLSIINNLRIDSNFNIQNQQLYNSIINNIPRKAAIDELFFVPLLKKINKNYSYDVGLIHYVKWIPDWISKHPTVFNRLLPADEIAIRNNDALFIRKTFSTFKNQTIKPKHNAVIITIGSENIDKIDYDIFLNIIKDTHDLYLLVMIDTMANISDKLKSQCIQAYSVVWNMIEQAHKKIASTDDESINPHYHEVIILKENDDPYKQFLSIPRSQIVSPPSLPNFIPLKSISSSLMKSVEYNPNYKIAYLFLLRSDINHPEIWSKYFVPDSRQYITRYVHSKEKHNIKTHWIRDALIEDIKETGWGFIIDAYFSLFREALKDPNNIKFVLISESCVPVKNFYEFKDYLDNTDYRNSYVHFLRVSSYDQQSRIENQPNYQQFGQFTKHYARMCLSRYHVDKLLSQSKSRINFFINMHVGDEFFLTLLNARPNNDYILDKTITYDNWEDVQTEVNILKNKIRELKQEINYTKNKSLENKIYELEDKMDNIRKNPKTYHEIKLKDIDTVFRSGSFFWRKFPANLSLEPYYDLYGALRYPRKKGGSKKRKYKIKKYKTRKYKTRKYKTRKYKLSCQNKYNK